MAPIPVHTGSPINTNAPSHAFGVSPSTAALRYAPYDSEARPISTTASIDDFSLQAAQPGARPVVPQPTNTAASASNGSINTAPTPTATASASAKADSPPPPQPGALPSPHTNPSIYGFAPAPPRPLEIPTLPQAQTPIRAPPLPITSTATIYTPTRAVPPSSTTSISTSPRLNYSSPAYTLPLPQVPEHHDLSHPPGYQQDHHRSFSDKPVESCQETDYRATLSPLSASRRGAGILDLDWTFSSPNGSGSVDGSDTVVQTAMSWARAAGKRLSMTEKQIWKSINGEDGT